MRKITPLHVRLARHVAFDANTGCLNFTGQTNLNGYGQLVDVSSGRRVLVPAHRVAWATAHGPIPEGFCVCHHCDNRVCVNPEHMFLGSRHDNNTDRHSKGRSGSHRGELNGRAVLSAADVLRIREEVRNGFDKQALATKYGLNKKYISHIAARKTWKHI